MTSLFSLTLSLFLTVGTPSLVLLPAPDLNQVSLAKAVPGIYVSDWEPATSWSTSKNQESIEYSYKRKLPELQDQQFKESQLIVFIRGYQFKDTSSTEKPLSLPFYIFMPEEKALQPLCWKYTIASGRVDITLHAPLDAEEKLSQSKGGVQFRYFILDNAFLKQQKLNPKALRNLSYQQVLQLTSKTP